MRPSISSASFLCSLAALSAAAAQALAQAQPLDVMPAPSEARVLPGGLAASGRLDVVARVAGGRDARLDGAVLRAAARWQARLGAAHGAPVRVSIECAAPGAAVPALMEDESYTLEVGASRVELRAPTVPGAMHGLETLLQLPRLERDGWFLPAVSIRDAPRFPWRGLLVDVARHWEPPGVIMRNLDAMAVVKLNVLHLHLTDDQGFRIESRTHPELQAKGSDGMFFTQAQMRAIIAYAAARGIRVVPEFDIPGHATSWVVSHPELASQPGPYGIERHWGIFNPVLDPTNEATYALLRDFLGEMAGLFPDRFVHIGGDENNGIQWDANPGIQAFIRGHDLGDNAGLHTYFNGRIEAILAGRGRRMVGWDEILHSGLPKSSVIESWRGTEALAAAAHQGYDGILANGYYIDLAKPASDHYLADPVPAASALTAPERAHALGGEASMWGEWVNPETIDSRIWPRTAAIAERLWSPQGVRDVDDMYRRLALVSARLEEAGALHLRNRDLMLRHLVGENLKISGIDSLRTFLGLVEPVKGYRRGEQQVWANQLVPLIGIADAAQPESAPAREFSQLADRMLFAPGPPDRALAAQLGASLAAWQAAAGEVAGKLCPGYPGLREALPGAQALGRVCAAGSLALRSLGEGTPIAGADLAACQSALAQACEPNVSATELPVVGPVRLLVAAASLQGERPGLSGDAWRARVTSAASAEAPSPAH
jgi:hexosaminidase